MDTGIALSTPKLGNATQKLQPDLKTFNVSRRTDDRNVCTYYWYEHYTSRTKLIQLWCESSESVWSDGNHPAQNTSCLVAVYITETSISHTGAPVPPHKNDREAFSSTRGAEIENKYSVVPSHHFVGTFVLTVVPSFSFSVPI